MDMKTLQEKDIVELLTNGEIDFIDAGCGTGGSLGYCKKTFGFPNELGFDLNEKKIYEAQLKGYRAYAGDILKINIPAKCVKYGSMMDFIEHLPNMQTAEKVLAILGNASKEFLFIRHPNCDDIEYLQNYELRMTWTGWTGHTNMMKISDYIVMFSQNRWRDYRIIPRRKIDNSDHDAIVPADAPKDTKRYSQLRGYKKEFVQFEKPIYAQFDIFIKMNDNMSGEEWNQITLKTT